MSLLTGRAAFAVRRGRPIPVIISSVHVVADAGGGLSAVAVCINGTRLEWYSIDKIVLEDSLPVETPPGPEPVEARGARNYYCDPGCPGEPDCQCVPF